MITWNSVESEPMASVEGNTMHIVIMDKYGGIRDIHFLYGLDAWESVVEEYNIRKWEFYDLLVQ